MPQRRANARRRRPVRANLTSSPYATALAARRPPKGALEQASRTPPVVRVTKPPHDEGAELEPDPPFEQAYCEMQNLPLTRGQRLETLTLLSTSLTDSDFRLGGPLDESEFIELSNAELADLLREYVDANGQPMYRYPRGAVFVDEDLPNPTNAPTPLLAALYDLANGVVLTDEVIYEGDLWPNAPEFAVEVAHLRVHGVAWANPPLGMEPKYAGQTLPSASTTSPDGLAILLANMSATRTTLRGLWLKLVGKQLAAQAESLAQLEQQLGTSNDDDAIDVPDVRHKIDVLLGVLAHAETYPKYDTSHPDSSLFYYWNDIDGDWAGERELWSMSSSAMAAYVAGGGEPLSVVVEAFLAAYDKYVADIGQYFGGDPSWYLTDQFQAPPGTAVARYLRYRSVFRDFLLALRARLYSPNADDDAQGAELVAIREAIAEALGERDRLRAIETRVATNALYEQWSSWLVSELREAVRVQRQVPGPLHHLVLTRRLGPFGELPRRPLRLVELPHSRQDDPLVAEPRVGLHTSYEMTITHRGFGAGRHLYSQTLFPGEAVEIQTRSLTRVQTSESETSAEKIFEETDSSSNEDFTRELSDTSNNSTKTNESEKHHFDASLKASYVGVVDLEASYGYDWSGSEEVQNFNSNLDKTLSKLATRLSNKRQVSFEISREVSTETFAESESTLKRKFANTNQEKTLTFNFFQVNRMLRAMVRLVDVELIYSSGKYTVVEVFTNDADPWSGERESDANGRSGAEAQMDAEALPVDLAESFDDGASIVIFQPPYSLRLPMARANAFLARTLVLDKARALNAEIWRRLSAEGGLGVGAFPWTKAKLTTWPKTGKQDWPSAAIDDEEVVADTVEIDGEAHPFANVDLRRRTGSGVYVPYVADDAHPNAVPLPTWSRDYVVGTEGIYAENMLGRCGALEGFATAHRDINVQLEQEKLDLQRALQPPKRDEFADDATFDKAIEQHVELVRAHRSAIVVDATPGTTVNVTHAGGGGDDGGAG